MPASQSALLLGPVHLLRWGCHSMSSCDGVRPIVVRAGSVLPEGVTCTPHEGSGQPQNSRHQPENWQRVQMFCYMAPSIRSYELVGRRQVLYIVMDLSSLFIVTGAVDGVRVRWSCTPRRVRRCGVISYALSRQPYFTSMSLRRLRLRVAAQASRTSLSRCFCNSRR